ncbi:MAG TPA: GYD domain-containing protein [Gemmatimonadales bacterium]|nr:GYD domain-containing protein [Gemmatimonadales bacterium]
MTPFIMLTRVSPEATRLPHAVETLERQAMTAIRAECPQVEWLHSWAVLGPYDYVDVFRAPDVETATKVATLVRIAGHATTEVWAATEWPQFKAMIRELPEVRGLIMTGV